MGVGVAGEERGDVQLPHEVRLNLQLVRSVYCMELSVIDGVITETVVVLTGDKGGGETVLCKVFPAIIIPRASEVRTAHIEVRVTLPDSSAHVQHADTGLGAPVVGEETQVLTGQVVIVTLQGRVGVVAGR